MRILYFAHDINDAAIARRVRMLQIGGAEVKLIGFHRGPMKSDMIEGATAIALGETFDQQLVYRAIQVANNALTAMRWRKLIGWSNVLLARNLEMTVLAHAARLWAGKSIPLMYEYLDIHPLSIQLPILRSVDRYILRRCNALIIPSSSFLGEFFEPLDGNRLPPVILAENKRVLPDGVQRPALDATPRTPPWRIGWCGILRNRLTFDLALALAKRTEGLIEFHLHGRPSIELQNPIAQLPLPNMRFYGSYAQADLDRLYRDCDFIWAIDRPIPKIVAWNLPNRLYEGGYYNIPTIALEDTAPAIWLRTRNAGVLVKDRLEDIERFFVNLSTAQYQQLRDSAAAIPTSDFVWSAEDCCKFTSQLIEAAE